jgi:hypothetical protein
LDDVSPPSYHPPQGILSFAAPNDDFEDLPATAKAIVDVIANGGTSIAMGAQAIDAAIKPLTNRISLRPKQVAAHRKPSSSVVPHTPLKENP